MGQMDLSSMRDALRYSLDNRGDLITTQLDRWLNWSYLHITQPRVHSHQQLQFSSASAVTMVADQVEYPLSGLSVGLWGLYMVVHVYGTDATDYTIRRRRLEGATDIRWHQQSWLTQGPPNAYSVWGGTSAGATPLASQSIWLDRRPGTSEVGQVLEVFGYQRPTRLTGTTDVTVLNEMWDEVVILGARWRGWRELNRPDRAEIAKLDFAQMIGDVQDATSIDMQDWGGRFELDLIDYQQME